MHGLAVADKTLSVTQLLRRIKNVVEVSVGEVWVEGEVSNLKKQSSGHWYFTLKDDGAQISCAMFGAMRREGNAALKDGAKVRVFAETSIYEARGTLQIIVLRAESAGLGDLQARFEALKRKLHGEGLFDAARKKKLPRFPRRVGIVTSDTGAAIQDMLNILGRRAPWIVPVLIPVRVQGRGAEREIAAAIRQFSRADRDRCDVLIVGRGGGSLEDLWCFNEEIVARAIADCTIPVVSAVGHEIDFTMADFVADMRAPTPSAAAELVAPDADELQQRVGTLANRMKRGISNKLEAWARHLEMLGRGPLRRDGSRLLREPQTRADMLRQRLHDGMERKMRSWEDALVRNGDRLRSRHPLRWLEAMEMRMEQIKPRLSQAMLTKLSTSETRLVHLTTLLRTLGPEAPLQRGYSITFDSVGKLVRSTADASSGTVLRTKVSDGEIISKVE